MHIVLHSCAQFATRTYAHIECEIVLDEIGSVSKCQASFLVSRLAASPLVLSLPNKAHICACKLADVLVPPLFRIPSTNIGQVGRLRFHTYVGRYYAAWLALVLDSKESNGGATGFQDASETPAGGN